MLSDYAKLAQIETLRAMRGAADSASWKPYPLSYFYGGNPLGTTLNPALLNAWVTPGIRNRVLPGGRASSKSHDAAGYSIFRAQSKKLKILCVRRFQNKIADSVFSLIKQKIEDFGLNHIFNVGASSITCIPTGTEYLFYGIERNINEIKSTEGVDILWIEEGQALTKAQWDILEPTIRKEGSEVWIVFNPALSTDFIYKNFVLRPPPRTLVRHINFNENPFLSQTMLDIIAAYKERESEEDFEHVYLGKPKNDNDKAVIQMKYLLAAVGANAKLGIENNGSSRIGYDVADDGDDVNAMVRAKGNECKAVSIWKGLEDELLKSATKVYREAEEHNALIVFDSIGVGAGVGSKFSELNEEKSKSYGFQEIEYIAFNAGAAVMDPDEVYIELPHRNILNKEHFENRKAQAWTNVADRLRHTYEAVVHNRKFDPDLIISIDPEMEDMEVLFEELTMPYKDTSNTGKFMVEPKKKLRERGIPSPNRADAFIMAFCEVERANYGFFSW